MNDRKTIAVVGATGAQGGGLVRAIAADPEGGFSARAITRDAYRSFGFPGADDLGNMFQFKADFEEVFCGARDPAVARGLNPELETFDDWLAANIGLIPIE